MPKTLEKPMTFAEVQNFLGCSKTWLYQQLQTGKLRAYKRGNRWLIFPGDLANYLNSLQSNQKGGCKNVLSR